MASRTRRMATPIAVLASMALALFLFATMVVSQAQAAEYTRANFDCGGSHNSGSYDAAGNLYIPCSTTDDPVIKNAGTADKESPSHIRVLSPSGAELRRITIPENTNAETTDNLFIYDVAPNATGSVLYLASETNGAVNPVKKFTVNTAGTSGTTSTFAPQTPWKLATDGDGNVYLSDNPSKKVYKYSPTGTLVTSFDARPPGGIGDIGGIAVNSAGTRVYVSQMHGGPSGPEPGPGPNYVNRFDSTSGVTYTHNANESIGGDYHWNNPQGGCSSHNVAVGDPIPVANWVGYFAYAWDVGLDGQGNIYALSTTCHEVLKFAPSGKTFLTGMKVNAEDTTFADNGRPHGLAVANNGEVYIGEASAKMDLPDPPTATCRGGGATITGTDNGETLSTTSEPRDVIAALGGNDTVVGFDDYDLACGGEGHDTFKVDGGAHFNTLDGDDGNAVDEEADTVSFGAFTSQGVGVNLSGHPHTDQEGVGYASSASLSMELTLYNISDVEGSKYRDGIVGSKLNNSLYGNDGDDTITGNEGKDFLDGGPGNDTINARDGVSETVKCGDGTDKATVDATDALTDCEAVDATAPRVTRVVPAENATDVAPAANVSAVFSEAMRANTLRNPDTLRSTTFKLARKNADGTTTAVLAKVSYAVTTNPTTGATIYRAILNPDANLQLGARYRAVVSAGARDLAGIGLDQDPGTAGNQPKVWFFTVRK